MVIFISAVLVMAAMQSFCRMALLARRWEYLTALLLVPFPFFFEEKIARTSMLALNRELSGASTLENWCALLVIQELFSLLLGFSLLEERGRVKEEISHGDNPFFRALRKYRNALVFFPSLLLPAGVLYLQMDLFNRFPGVSFRALTWSLALVLPPAAVLFTEMIRFLRKNYEDRILTVLHGEFFLLIAAVFLPVAANAHLIPGEDPFPMDGLVISGILAALVLLCTLGFQFHHLYSMHHRRKKHVDSHSNS